MQPNGNGLVSNLENLKQVFQDHNFHPDHLTWLEPFIQAAGQGSLLPEQATLLQRMWYTTGKIIRKQATRDDLHHLFGSQQIWIECMDEAMFGPVFYRLGKVLQAAKHPIPSSAAASKPSTRTQHPLFALMIRQLHEAKALLPFFKGIMYWRQDVRAELVARYELLNGKLPVALTVNDPDGNIIPADFSIAIADTPGGGWNCQRLGLKHGELPITELLLPANPGKIVIHVYPVGLRPFEIRMDMLEVNSASLLQEQIFALTIPVAEKAQEILLPVETSASSAWKSDLWGKHFLSMSLHIPQPQAVVYFNSPGTAALSYWNEQTKQRYTFEVTAVWPKQQSVQRATTDESMSFMDGTNWKPIPAGQLSRLPLRFRGLKDVRIEVPEPLAWIEVTSKLHPMPSMGCEVVIMTIKALPENIAPGTYPFRIIGHAGDQSLEETFHIEVTAA